MNKTFSLLFYVKKGKTTAKGYHSHLPAITIDSSITEIASKRYIQPDKWNSAAQKANGSNPAQPISGNRFLLL